MSAEADNKSLPSRRRLCLRLAAVVLGLSCIVLAEGVCRVAGWGDPALRDDPFVGFAGTRPLFVLSDDGSEYVVPIVREEFFARDRFPAKKPAGSRRVFCLGGSTVQGRPWSIATSFTKWLELALNVIDEDREWDVVNCGGISYASYRLVPILEECLHYEPDLIILCTGHNEFLETRTYADVSRSPLVHQASDLRLVNVAREWIDRVGGEAETATAERTILPLETEPILNFNDGLKVYHRDETWRRGVVEHYEINVRRMISMARAAGVPLVLMQPASNLRDCPPFKSEHRAGLSAADREAWESLIVAAREAPDPVQATAFYQKALRIDAEYALTHYELGRAHLSLLDTPAARASLLEARDLDICPLRMISELEERLRQAASDRRVPFIDMHELLEGRSADGILGDRQLVDHIHPSVEGHQHIADALVRQLASMGFVTLSEQWESAAHAAYAAHLSTLESAYFLRGQRMLDGLRAWSQGRADGPPAAERFPEAVRESH